MINEKKENKVKWWNAPQYSGPISGVMGLICVKLLVYFYDLSGFAAAYRSYFIWGTILFFIGLALLIRAFRARRLR